MHRSNNGGFTSDQLERLNSSGKFEAWSYVFAGLRLSFNARIQGSLAIPIELKYLENGGMRFIATGALTGKEILDANKTIYETEEKTLASVYQIYDYRGVETIDVPTDDIRTLAERDKRAARINPNIIIAVVVGDDLAFGMTRMWQGLTSGAPFVNCVFRSMDEAERWVAEQLEATR